MLSLSIAYYDISVTWHDYLSIYLYGVFKPTEKIAWFLSGSAGIMKVM